MKTSPVIIALGCLFFLCPFAEARTSSQPPSHGVPRIEITPNTVFIDQPVKILLRNFPAKQIVAVQLLSTNLPGQPWQSHATFLTDRYGNADLATQAPLSGTYRHADPAGLFWSLSPADPNKANREELEPWHYELAASVNGRIVATATMERFILCPGVRQIQVRDHGLRGTLFLPAGKGPWPAVIVLTGSEGGLWDLQAAFLAAKGYAAFALGYYRYEDLPMALENIPLEYFQTAIHWLQARDDIKRNSIGVVGISRGGELVLLLGATFPEIHAVVAISASSVLWGGVGAGTPLNAVWTYRGKPLPFMGGIKLTDEQKRELQQLSRTNSEAEAFGFLARAYKAFIPVEKINGPILLISGDDDKLWPSTQMENEIMKRLAQARHPFPDRHLAYPGAGHGLYFPNQPTTMNTVVFATGEKRVLGGDPDGNAAAAADAWPRIVAFLNQSLNLDHR